MTVLVSDGIVVLVSDSMAVKVSDSNDLLVSDSDIAMVNNGGRYWLVTIRLVIVWFYRSVIV